MVRAFIIPARANSRKRKRKFAAMKLQDYFRAEDLNDDLRLVASVCGDAAAFGLAEHFAGMNLYIPGRPLAKAKERAIFERYNQGESITRLAVAFGYSSQWVFEIVKRAKEAKAAAPKQANLFSG